MPTTLNTVLKCLTLTGAISLPLASMANDASGFPSVPTLTGEGIWLDGPDATLFLAQSTGGGETGGGETGGGQTGGGQTGGGRGSYGGNSGREKPETTNQTYPTYPTSTAPDASGITSSGTDNIVRLLTTGTDFCQRLRNPAYNVDCLSYQFWLTAQAMPKSGGYSDARQTLLDAATKLHNLAVANRDTSKPVAKAKVDGKTTTRPLTPVKNVAAVNAQAEAIVRDTNLVLLRSNSESNQRRLAYVEIAAVVNSTKVLLRSS